MIVGLDFRPATGQLYALGYNSTSGASRLYTVNLSSAIATPVGASDFMLDAGESFFGFDFNPTVDRIRLVTGTDNNYRLHPITGTIVATDGNIAYALTDVNSASNATVLAGAYTNSYIGSTSTSLFVYEATNSVFALQSPPNNGVLNTIGNMGPIAPEIAPDAVDMDIYFNPSTGMNTCYFTGYNGINQTLYSINTTNGAPTAIGLMSSIVSDFAVEIIFNPPSTISGSLIYGLTSNNYLISFDSQMPSTVRSHIPLSGVTVGQMIVGLDSRPATGQVFAMGYNSTTGETQLYTVNVSSGTCTSIAPAITLATGMTQISFDFNPTVDRIRVTSKENQNYRLHPVTGAIVATDLNLNYSASDPNAALDPSIGAGAYTNSYIGSTSTQLFNYDLDLNTITLQNPPNNGVLNTIGTSGISINVSDPSIDFDFYYNSANAMNENYAIANTSSTFDNLYSVNISNGMFTSIGQVGYGIALIDITVQIVPNIPPLVSGQTIYGVTSNQYLITFDSENPSVVRTHIPITGITAGQLISGLDVRPATGELYAIGYEASTGLAQLYTINTTSGMATSIAPAIMLATNMSNLSFDFNPMVDRIRLVSSNGNNYRLHPTTGAIAATDINLAYSISDVNNGVTPKIGSGAYTNSFGGTNNTKLFVYDDSLNVVALQNPPNNGILNTIGNSGIVQSLTDRTSDIDIYYNHTTHTNTAFLISNSSTFDQLHTLNTTTGISNLVGLIGNGIALRDIAVMMDTITSITSSSSTDTTSACGIYTAPDNMVYTQSGNYTAIIDNAIGYDSLITIVLTVNNVDNSVTVLNDNSIVASESNATYQWIDCNTNTELAGETNQTFMPSINGSYAVVITATNGCIDTSACQTISSLSIKEQKIVDFTIAPNPTNGLFSINLLDNLNQSIRISDATGKIIFEREITGNTITLDLSTIQNGIYFVTVGNSVKQLIKY